MSEDRYRAERALLGSILLDGSLVDDVGRRVVVEHFARPQHQALYRRLLADEGDSVGIFPRVMEYLGHIGDREAEAYGGIAYVASLPNAAGGAPECWETWADSVIREYRVRTIRLVLVTGQSGLQGCEDPAELASDLSGQLAEIAQDGRQSDREPATVARIMPTHLEALAERRNNPEASRGVPWGIGGMDDLSRGLHPKQLVILAGRPAMGKSTVARHVAVSAARAGVGVLLVSLEMDRRAILDALLSSTAYVRHDLIRDAARMDRGQYEDCLQAADHLTGLPIVLDDSGSATVPEIRRAVLRWRRRLPIGLVVVDYLQLMRPAHSRRDSNRVQDVSEISRGLKEMAMELHMPVLALSQLNRAVEGRTDKRPMLADLRDSGAIEQDADVVVMVHRPEVYEPGTQPGLLELCVRKQRAGRIGIVGCTWQGEYQRLEYDPGRGVYA